MRQQTSTPTWPQRAVAAAYLPGFLIGFGGSVMLMAVTVSHDWLVVLLLVAVGVSVICEQIAPYEQVWNRGRQDRRRDVFHAVVNEGMIVAGIATLSTLRDQLWQPGWWPGGLPFVVQVLGALVIVDGGITLVHRTSHRWGWLWRFHAVHHSVTRLYGFNGLMKHPIHQAAETTGGMLPLLALGIPTDVAAAVAGLVHPRISSLNMV